MSTFTMADIQSVNNFRLYLDNLRQTLDTSKPENGLKFLRLGISGAQRLLPPGVRQIVGATGKAAIVYGERGSEIIRNYQKKSRE